MADSRSSDAHESPARSLRGRAALAVALTVAFYGLAIVVAVGLIAGPLALEVSAGRGNIWLTIACIAAGLTILRAIIPPRNTFTPPGPELTRAEQPELHAELDRVAAATGAEGADAVYLDLAVNAAVLEHRRRRIMILGLPLLATLGRDELAAVIAHEYGHYVGGDTRFSNWIWRTRVAVLQTVQRLASSGSAFQNGVVRLPFDLYARLFLRITNALSRRAEYAADALSGRVAGPDAAGRALRRVGAVDAAWGPFWRADVVTMLEAERRPSIALGLRQATAGTVLGGALDQIVEADLEAREPDPYASHPTLRQRLEALGAAVEATAPPAPADPAATLLRGSDELERRLLVHIFGDEVAALPAGDWSEAGAVHAAALRRLAERFGSALPGAATIEGAGALAADRSTLREGIRRVLEPDDRTAPDEAVDGLALDVLVAAVVTAAAGAGARITAEPGEPVLVHHAGRTLGPAAALGAIAAGEEDAATWRRAAAEAALDAVPLRAAEPVAAA